MSDQVWLLGAGASLVGESGLPLFTGLRENLLSRSGLIDILDQVSVVRAASAMSSRGREFEPLGGQTVSGDPEELTSSIVALLASFLAPEALLLVLQDGGADVTSLLLDAFNSCGAEPNLIHDLAAFTIGQGGVVWTTNYDTLVEEAATRAGVTVRVGHPSDPGSMDRANLVKLHGSFNERDASHPTWAEATAPLAFSAPHILGGLPSAAAERFALDVGDSDVTVFGYAGADIDLFPELRKTMSTARSVCWHVPSGIASGPILRDLVERYNLTPGSAGKSRHRVVVSQDPGQTLYREMVDRRSDSTNGAPTAPTTPSLPKGRPTAPKWSRLPKEAIALGQDQRVRLAYQLSLGSHLHTNVAEARSAPRAQARLWLRGHARAIRGRRWSGALLRLLTATWTPEAVRSYARWVASHDLRSSEAWPDAELLEAWLDERWSAPVGLAACRLLSYDGHLERANRVAERGLGHALNNPSTPDRAGSYAFQLADQHRTIGEFDSARQQALRGYAAVSSVVMALWQEFTRLAAQVTDTGSLSDIEMTALHSLIEAFGVAAEPAGAQWAGLVMGVALKNAKQWDSAETVLRQVTEEARIQDLLLVASVSEIQIADLIRMRSSKPHRETEVAVAGRLERTDDRLLHKLFAALVRALSRIDPDTDEVRALRTDFERAGNVYGMRVVDVVLATPLPEWHDVPVNWI